MKLEWLASAWGVGFDLRSPRWRLSVLGGADRFAAPADRGSPIGEGAGQGGKLRTRVWGGRGGMVMRRAGARW